jgi:hypothetical protein
MHGYKSHVVGRYSVNTVRPGWGMHGCKSYRVASEDNIADLPSRCVLACDMSPVTGVSCCGVVRYEFQLLNDLKAVWRDPACTELQLSPA